jgi:hypothetical protein
MSNVGGIVSPSVFAVFMLITRLNFVGCEHRALSDHAVTDAFLTTNSH